MTLPDTITLTEHAIGRILDMRIEPAEIERTLLQPKSVLPHKTEPTERVYIKGRLILVVDHRPDGMRAVVTAMWATKHARRLDDLHGPMEGRKTYREARSLGLTD